MMRLSRNNRIIEEMCWWQKVAEHKATHAQRQGRALGWQLLTFVQQEPDTLCGQDTLLHGETLFVVPACNAKHIAGELLTQDVSVDL